MLSRNLYKMKKAPLGDKRKKAILGFVLTLSIFFIAYGVYSFQKIRPADGKKEDLVLETGDRPLKKNQEIYINADGGLTLREDRNQSSNKLAIIPNKTKLEATEELEGWYKVEYQGKTGWILKKYTTINVPAEDPFKDWQTFSTSTYKIKYPIAWKVKNYGVQTGSKTTSLVAFSNQELPETLPKGSEFVAPVIIRVISSPIEEVKKDLAAINGVAVEEIAVSGQKAFKFTYTSAFSNTQVSSIVLAASGKTIEMSEAGGYLEDLMNMIKTFSLGG